MGIQWLKNFWKKITTKNVDDLTRSLEQKIIKGGQGSHRVELELGDFWKGDSFLTEEDSAELKRRLLFKITTLPSQERAQHDMYNLAQELRGTASSLHIAPRRNFHMKQRVLEFVQQQKLLEKQRGRVSSRVSNRQDSFVFPNVQFRVVLSSLVLFFFILTTFLLLPFQIPVTHAAHLTYVEEAYGQVFILRNGLTLAASTDFSLQEGDVIFTKEDGFATIRFFDDSTSRLGQNTRLELKQLSLLDKVDDTSLDISTQVEVLLESGRMWTRVLHLIGDQSHFMVDTKHAYITATKKAAFDIHTDPEYSRVAVFDNVIDLAPRVDDQTQNQKSIESKSLTAGFQIEVSPSTSKTSLISEQTDADVSAKTDLTSSSWIESNLAKDKVHAEKISQEREDRVTSSLQLADISANTVAPVDSTDESRIVENNEVELQMSSFLRNYNVFIQGQSLLVQKQLEKGMKLLLQFEGEVRTFMVNYPHLLQVDEKKALALHSFVEQKIAEQKKELMTFLPGDALYPAKEVLEETELFLYQNEIDKTLVRLNQAEGKLLEMQDLVEQGNMDLAQRLFVRYETQMKTIGFELDEENYKSFQQKLIIIFDKQIQQMKVLTVLEQSFDGSTRESLSKIRHELLLRLRSVVRSPYHLLPPYLVVKLKSLLAIYLDQHIDDKEFVYSLNQLLILHGEKNSFIPANTNTEADDLKNTDSVKAVEGESVPDTSQKDQSTGVQIDDQLKPSSLQPESVIPIQPEIPIHTDLLDGLNP